MPSAAIIAGAVAAIVAVFAGYIYVFGIPPEMKRDLERKALKTMGENKASYIAKDQINKIPDSDQQDVKDLKKGLGNLGGGALQNPLGETAGEGADDATRPFTGR